MWSCCCGFFKSKPIYDNSLMQELVSSDIDTIGVNAQYTKAVAQYGEKKYAEAVKNFTELLPFIEHDLSAKAYILRYIGNSKRRLEDFEGAEEALQASLVIEPDNQFAIDWLTAITYDAPVTNYLRHQTTLHP